MRSAERTPGHTLLVGCGYAGTRLARRWLEAGPVLALVRGAASAEALLSQGIPAFAVDLDAEVPRLALPSDLGSVIYLAPPAGG